MDVIVYSSDFCIHCKRQKEFLEKLNIPFKEVDVNSEGKDEFIELGGIGTPLTVIKKGDELVSKITGFNEKQLREALKSI